MRVRKFLSGCEGPLLAGIEGWGLTLNKEEVEIRKVNWLAERED